MSIATMADNPANFLETGQRRRRLLGAGRKRGSTAEQSGSEQANQPVIERKR
jgi:hypothetical protein